MSVGWRGRGLRAARLSCLVVLGVLALSAAPAAARAHRRSGPPPFVPITYIRLHLPTGVEPYGPSWMPDGRHILFQNQLDGHTWVIDANGRGLRCLTCGFKDDPGPTMQGGLLFTYSFPDQKRLLLAAGGYVTYGNGQAASGYGLSWVGALSGVSGSEPPPSKDVADVLECHPNLLHCRRHTCCRSTCRRTPIRPSRTGSGGPGTWPPMGVT